MPRSVDVFSTPVALARPASSPDKPGLRLDASLVPETWRDSFVNWTAAMSQVSGESRTAHVSHYDFTRLLTMSIERYFDAS